MRNCLLKVGQADQCGLGPVHLFYVFINTFFFPNVVYFMNNCDYSSRIFFEEV